MNGSTSMALAVLMSVTAALSLACASRQGQPYPFPSPAGSSVPPSPKPQRTPAPALPHVVAATALDLRGTPYRNGGSDPGGFDCSGFTQYVFARHGISLPREVREQFGEGRAVTDRLTTGDLIFFATTSKGPSHVGIVVGAKEFVHAPSSRGVVRVERFDSSYWATRVIGVRRIVAD